MTVGQRLSGIPRATHLLSSIGILRAWDDLPSGQEKNAFRDIFYSVPIRIDGEHLNGVR